MDEEYLKANFIRLNQVKLGKDVKLFAFVNAYGCQIGDGTKIGTFVEIQKMRSLARTAKSLVTLSFVKA